MCSHSDAEWQAGLRLHDHGSDIRRVQERRRAPDGRARLYAEGSRRDVPGITEYQLHYPKPTMGGSVNNPPKDYKMWGELVRKYTEHLVERYGRQEVSTWYFEVWNEPDIVYWHGTPAEYFKLYDYAVAGVRAALPNAIVGGPASTGPANEKASAFLDGFLKHCLNDKSAADGKPIPLDFISFHPKGRPKLVDGHVRMGISNELKATREWFSDRREISATAARADHPERGRSRRLRRLLNEGESGERVSQRPALSDVHSRGDEGDVRTAGRGEGESARDAFVVV